MRARPRLSLSVQAGDAAPACPVPRPQLRRWVQAALLDDARITLRLVGTREARTLNRDFRGSDHATNVLTFAYETRAHGVESPACVADIVICLPVVEREALRQRKPIEHHFAHLVIHGVLHAQGFAHDDDLEAQAMEAIETAVLARFRIPDPYAPALGRRGRVRLS